MRSLQFLFLLLAVVILGLGLISYALYDSPALLMQGFEAGMMQSQSIWAKLTEYFQDAGSWNYLILSFFLALCLILYVINDLFLERWFVTNQKKGFLRTGFIGLTRRLLASALLVLELVFVANLMVICYANTRMVYEAEAVQGKHTVLLLGTSKHLQDNPGQINLYYQQRIEAVSRLIKANKVKRIIISGDNGKVGYNEPADMQQSLIAHGVPAHLIALDYAGFRTLDSIVRLKGHFGVEQDVIIVSQRFHVERALALAWSYGVEALGYSAEGNPTGQMIVRELLAKPKALLDVFVFNMQPRYGRTYAKSTINWANPRDKQFTFLVAGFWLFALLLIFLFYKKK